MPLTKGFRDRNELLSHHQRHQAEFGSIDVNGYLSLADAFLGSPKNVDVLECIRKRDGAILRYNPKTNEFGIIAQNGIIKTYFKPDLWNKKKYPTGLDYFKDKCNQ